MNFTLYQVDAFTDTLFGGNPAAVIPLTQWIEEPLMQQLAGENNLSETVFFVPSHEEEYDYEIRWFTPLLKSTCVDMQRSLLHIFFLIN